MKKILLSAMMLCGVGVSNANDVVITVTEPGTVKTNWGSNPTTGVRRIKIKGPINGTDMKYLRDFAVNSHLVTTGNVFDTRLTLDLSEAHFRAGGETYKVLNNSQTVSFSKDDVVPAYCFAKDGSAQNANFGKIILPNSVTKIEHHALYNCEQLGYAVIGENTVELGNSAFRGNTNMRGLFITEKNSLKTLNQDALNIASNNFHIISIPEHVETISPVTSTEGPGLNGGTGVKAVYVNSAANCGNGTCNGSTLKELHILSVTPPTMGASAIFKMDTSSKIYVPFGSLEAHKNAFKNKGGRDFETDGKTLDQIKEAYLPLPSAASHGETWSTWSDAPGKYYEIPDGVKVYTVNGYHDGAVNMASVSGSIPAEGCVINANAAGSVIYTEGTEDPTTLRLVGVFMMDGDTHSNASYNGGLWQKMNTAAANATKAKAKSLESGIWLKTAVTATAPTINGTNYLVGTGTGTAEVGPVVEVGGEVTYRNFYLNWYNLNDTSNEEAYDLGFYRAAQSTLGAHKAYLRLPASVIGNVGGAEIEGAAASQLRIVFNEDFTTGVQAATMTEAGNGVLYNLHGQKVTNPTSGIYVKNGKRIVIK